MNIKIIKNNSDYQEALQQLSELIQKPYVHNSDTENTIEILMLVIKDYEQKVIEPSEFDPIEAIKFRMDQMGLDRKDMIEYFGSIHKVSEVLRGKRKLSLTMIRKLHHGLKIPLKSLIGKNKELFDSANSKIDYSLFPINEMKNRGYVKDQPNIKDHAEEIVKEFCKGYDNILEDDIAYLRAPLHLRGKKTIDKYALIIWQIYVLKQAQKLALKPYDPSLIDEKWLRSLIGLSIHREGPKLAKEFLESYGIALIIEPHFKKTFLDGAAMMFNNRPVIALTLRHDRIDNFWFVLIHELAHLMKHLNANDRKAYFDDLDEEENLDVIELEADSIANETMIPAKHSKELSNIISIKDIHSLAQKLHISPAIIAGRLRHETKDYRRYGKLVSEKVIL